MEISEQVIQEATLFYNELKNDSNARYRSWEHCYYSFYMARNMEKPDIDYLSLQLAFYLASWGMYRGSSFLLQKDYKIHIPVIEELLKSKYDILFGVECKLLFEPEIQELFQELSKYISEFYDSIRHSVKNEELKNALSSTLITKFLMGTMGCVPAYDRYFVTGIKTTKIATGNYNIRSIMQLAKFYEQYFDDFETARKKFVVNDIIYPQMKLLDMGFWKIGIDITGG